MRKILTLPTLAMPEQKAGAALPRDAKTPVFEEAWQGHAVAIVTALYQDGHYDWAQWDDYLGPQIASPDYFGGAGEAPGTEEPPPPAGANYNRFLADCEADGANYYHYWLAAMEHLLDDIGLVPKAELDARTAAIAKAEATPPRFQVGDRVHIVEREGESHSHIPHYLREVPGRIESDRGLHVLPEALPGRGGHDRGHDHGHGGEALLQHVYAVNFAAQDIWPDARHSLNFTLWDNQLSPA
jgi:hypothetical protein